MVCALPLLALRTGRYGLARMRRFWGIARAGILRYRGVPDLSLPKNQPAAVEHQKHK